MVEVIIIQIAYVSKNNAYIAYLTYTIGLLAIDDKELMAKLNQRNIKVSMMLTILNIV